MDFLPLFVRDREKQIDTLAIDWHYAHLPFMVTAIFTVSQFQATHKFLLSGRGYSRTVLSANCEIEGYGDAWGWQKVP